MIPRMTLALLLVIASLTSCAYRGAIYCEHTQIGLDVRANANSSSGPILGSVGYDHGISSFVPRRNSGTHGTAGESVSVISWNYTGTKTGFDPLHPTNSALIMDAGFISGTAAAVAAAPAHSVIKIVSAGEQTQAVVTTDSSAGKRIVSAMQPYDEGLKLGRQQRNVLKAAADKIWAASDRAAAIKQVLAGLDANALGRESLDSIASRLAAAPDVATLERRLRPYSDSSNAIQQNLDKMNK